MTFLTDFAPWVRWWAGYYGNHALVSTSVTYLHLAGLVVGGGAAVTTDRQILRAWHRGGDRRPATLQDVAAVHRFVVGGLAVTVVTGLLMFFADVDTFRASSVANDTLTSRIYTTILVSEKQNSVGQPARGASKGS